MIGYFGDGSRSARRYAAGALAGSVDPGRQCRINGFVGLCLESHDLLVAEHFAGRQKDHAFCLAIALIEQADPKRACIAAKISSHFPGIS